MFKKILNFIVILIIFLICTIDVYALPTGEYWSESATNKYQLGSFLWSYGDFPLYGLNGDGSFSYSPKLDTFYNGQNSLFTYDGNVNLNNTRGGYAIRFYLNKTLMSGNTYDVNIKFGGNTNDLTYYFSNPSDIDGTTLNQKAFTCSNNICTLTMNVKANSNLSIVYVNFNNPGDGLNGYYANQIIQELYFPQIQSTSSFDTSGIENRQDQIIDQNQTIIDNSNKTNQELGNLNDSLNDSDTSDATNEAGNFFSGFETNTFGLTSIITAPLDLIGSITSSSCSPLGLQVPFVDNVTLNLPCMSTIYQKHFGSFLSVYQTITFGIVAYWVCVRIFALVKDFKNPDHDEIEVLDL